ncbi:MAG: helix-turn-helix transcriptional regulator [Phenylobacterium sp.]
MAIEGEGTVRFIGVARKLSLEPGAAEAQDMGELYRRTAVAVDSPHGRTVNHETRVFAGARAGFLSNATDGVITIIRTAEDVAADGFTGMGISLVIGGHLRVLSGGRDESFQAGDLFAEHTVSPRTGVSAVNPAILIYIPKARFLETITAPAEQINLMRLNHAPLAPVVIPQIEFLAENFGRISPEEFEAALETVVELLLVMLRREVSALPPLDPVLAAAKAHVAAHFRDFGLTPDSLAKALGCSRAVLYRAFAPIGVTVVRYVRDVRFHHFLQALRVQPDASISKLAYESGFATHPSDFTKLFKRTYGMTPSQLQTSLHPGRSSPAPHDG